MRLSAFVFLIALSFSVVVHAEPLSVSDASQLHYEGYSPTDMSELNAGAQLYPKHIYQVIQFAGRDYVSADTGIYKIVRNWAFVNEGKLLWNACFSTGVSSYSCSKINKFDIDSKTGVGLITVDNKEIVHLDLQSGDELGRKRVE